MIAPVTAVMCAGGEWGPVKRLCALLLSCALLSSPAAAQDSRRHRPRPAAGSPAETHAFATCIADDYYGTYILEMLPGTQRERYFVEGATQWDGRSCRPANRLPVVDPPYMRGAAAEYLLETAAARRRLDQRVFPMPDNEALQGMSAATRAEIIFIQIGQCAARADLPGVMAVLAAPVGAPDERAALRNIVPAIAGCVPEGISFQLVPLLVRAYLAEGAYRNNAVELARPAR